MISTVTGGRVLHSDGTFRTADVAWRDGQITAIGSAPPDANAFDASGAIVAPGFVDTHVHGAGGSNFMMGEPRAVSAIAIALLRNGVTSALMATASVPREETIPALTRMRRFVGRHPSGLDLLGLHLEGPFLSFEYRGVHRADAVRAPADDEVAEMIAALGPALRVVTMAPEVDGAVRAAERFIANGTRVSIGHTGASAADVHTFTSRGVRRATHVLNAMPSRAESTLVDELFADPRVVVELIADGHHVLHPAVRTLYKELGPERIAVVSDGADVTGLPDGPHRRWEGTDVVLLDGVSRTPSGTLAGSVSPLDASLRFLVRDAGVPLADALQSLSATPAQSIGATSKGELSPGHDADLVILDEELRVRATIAGGRLVHNVH